jgi:uncharacterized damage-inducible protein DinB
MTDALEQIRRLWAHSVWADAAVFGALRGAPGDAPNAAQAWREYAHVLGAEEVWLSRLERRASKTPVWPTLTVADSESLRAALAAGYDAYLARLTPESLGERVPYTNSAGQHFETPVVDILLHVALHGQYHRGKVNLLLRQEGAAPAPTDFIAFARGVPAATTPVRA